MSKKCQKSKKKLKNKKLGDYMKNLNNVINKVVDKQKELKTKTKNKHC